MLISKHCDDMLRLYGRKEPLVHDKGYYQSCDAVHKLATLFTLHCFAVPAEQQQAVDRHLQAKRRELDDQRKSRLQAQPVADTSDANAPRSSRNLPTEVGRMIAGVHCAHYSHGGLQHGTWLIHVNRHLTGVVVKGRCLSMLICCSFVLPHTDSKLSSCEA
jgi:hypothetical protein